METGGPGELDDSGTDGRCGTPYEESTAVGSGTGAVGWGQRQVEDRLSVNTSCSGRQSQREDDGLLKRKVVGYRRHQYLWDATVELEAAVALLLAQYGVAETIYMHERDSRTSLRVDVWIDVRYHALAFFEASHALPDFLNNASNVGAEDGRISDRQSLFIPVPA